ncbi:MAG: hypothetical protein KAT68_10585 [Bacteroidales bacterium]|nr:hypothetical protein [Bacteroidales bacterium]
MQNNSIYIRINGKGNAWPVFLGTEHPFYSKNNYENLSNSSYSIISFKGKEIQKNSINWEILIDAGHGIIQYLIKNHNRIPEAVFLTHSHIDHTLGIDWLIQSYYRTNNYKLYPVYATKLCWGTTLQSFPHLAQMVDFNELIPGELCKISQTKGLSVIPFPVFHGEASFGSVMLAFFTETKNSEQKKVVISGDLLCPLLRKNDYNILSNPALLIADANNRFPYPKCNHWSISDIISEEKNDEFKQWKEKLELPYMINTHLRNNKNTVIHNYFNTFLEEQYKNKDLIFNVFDFAKRISPKNVMLVHYSGKEDDKYYNQPQLSEKELIRWVNEQKVLKNINSEFIIPDVGYYFGL